MIQSKPKRRNFFIVSAILLVLFLFSYYFFAYIPNKENDMKDRGIRVMNRMVENIHKKEDHYNKSIEMFKCSYILAQIFETEVDTSIIIDNLIYSNCTWNIMGLDSIINLVEDEIAKENENANIDYKELIEFQDSLLTYHGFLDRIKSTIKIDPKVKFIKQADSSEYLYTQALEDNREGLDTWEYQDSWQESSMWNNYILGISSSNFLKGIKRFEFFDDIFIVDPKTNKLLDSSAIHLKHYYYNKGVKSADSNKIENQNSGEMLQISGVDISESKISNADYYSYTTSINIQGRQYYLTGLISKKKYNAQVRSVSVWVIMISFVFLLFLVQILPIAKPFLLTKKERLQGSDMLWSVVSLVFGMAALALFALGIDTFSIEEINSVDKKLELYANRIADSFKDETNEALNILYEYSLGDIQDSTRNKINNFIGNSKATVSFLGIDKTGKAFDYAKIGADNKLNVLKTGLDLSHREYYKIHATKAQNRVWNASFNPNLPTYFMESIFSLSSGKYETVVSTKTGEDSIWALVFPFHSVNNVYLEPNYSYSIIDEKGVIHFHSDPSKIKNENFLDENSQKEMVQSFIGNTSKTEFNMNFSLKDYRAHIQPIKNTTWFLVSLYDIQKSRLTVTSSMAVTFQFILAVLLYLLFLHALFRLQTVLNNDDSKGFSYYFLNPLTTARKTYTAMYLVNIGLILFLIGVYKYNDLNLHMNATLYFAGITLAIIYNYGMLLKSENDYSRKGYFQRLWPFSKFENFLFILSIVWISVYINQDSVNYLLIVPLCAMVVLIIKQKLKPSNGTSKSNEKESEKKYRPYYLHAFTWVIIFSLLPALLFFKPIYNQQQINRSKHNLQEEFNHHISLQHWDNRKVSIFNSQNYKPIYQNQKTKSLLDQLNIYMDTDGSHLRGMDKSENYKLEIQKGFDDTLSSPIFRVELEPNTPYYYQEKIEPNYILAFSLPHFFNKKSFKNAMFFWFYVVLSLVLLYYLIVKISEKFFYLDLTRTLSAATPLYFQDASKSNSGNLGNETIIQENENNILLVGLPYSGRNKLANNSLKLSNVKVLNLDFLKDLDEVKDEVQKAKWKNAIVINNFDFRIFNFDHNIKKLEILEFILSERNRHQIREKLILISSLDIYQIIEIYQENIKLLAAQKKVDNNVLIETRRNTINRWESVLFGFTKYIIALKGQNDTDDYLEHELSFGNALKRAKPSMLNYRSNLEDNAEDLNQTEIKEKVISAIQERAENYYFSIWNSCSKEEKFALFDLAQDGLLNSNNTHVIQRLVRRGILIINPQLAIFNTSFAQFIIESISEEESKQMEMEAKKHGTWNTYKYLVIFLVLVIVIFLSFVEEQSFTKITGTVSLGALLLPNILRIVNVFSSKKGTVSAAPPA